MRQDQKAVNEEQIKDAEDKRINLFALVFTSSEEQSPCIVGDEKTIVNAINAFFNNKIQYYAEMEDDGAVCEKDAADLNGTKRRVLEALDDIIDGKIKSFQFDASTQSWESESVCMLNAVSIVPKTIIRPSSDCTVQFAIRDEANPNQEPLLLNVREGNYGVLVAPSTYDVSNADHPIAIDYFNGQLNVLTYDDTQDDPTHKIPIEIAPSSLFHEDEDLEEVTSQRPTK
jgi:hypothetical protein